jgi:deoxyribose-phosphate aldolase
VDADRALLIRCLDLTALGDDDDPASIDALCARASAPVPDRTDLTVAAVCIWPRFVSLAVDRLAGTAVRVACATGGFPVPDEPLVQRLDQIRRAVDAGAQEVDVVCNRWLLDEPSALHAELDATRAAAGSATWKAILETGALTKDGIRLVGDAAVDSGADFLKTSTGKAAPGATPEAVAIVAQRVAAADRSVGLKISGGIRTVGQATSFLRLARTALGPAWPNAATFRIGASTLLDSLLESRQP